MNFGCAGKAVLVAGGSRGIGRGIAAAFARERAQVAICARSSAELTATAQALRDEFGATILPIVADFHSRADVDALVQQVATAFGRLDVLVTNSGPPPALARFDEVDGDEVWFTAFREQFMPVVRLARAALPHMVKQGGGSIVNLTSAAAKEFMARHVHSATMRMAVIGLAKHLALEMAEHGIRVNCVCQASIVTERFLSHLEKGIFTQEARMAAVPLGRLGRVDELAIPVLFLASDAASYITGQALAVDGGQVRAML